MANESRHSLEGCNVDELLTLVVDTVGASDLHLAVGLPPVLRVDGKLFQAPYEEFTAPLSQRFLYDILTPEQIQEFEAKSELDFAYAFDSQTNFRVNVFREKGAVAAAFRSLAQ